MKGKMKDKAVLAGFSSNSALVFEEALDLADYRDESHPAIDEDRFRKDKNIRKLVGRLHGSNGRLLQEFESTYDETGSFKAPLRSMKMGPRQSSHHEAAAEPAVPADDRLPRVARSCARR